MICIGICITSFQIISLVS